MNNLLINLAHRTREKRKETGGRGGVIDKEGNKIPAGAFFPFSFFFPA